MKENRYELTVQKIHGHLEVAAMTDCGNKRTINEDGFLVDHNSGLILVADGMSGQGGDHGAQASALAIKTIHDYLTNSHTQSIKIDNDETVFAKDNDETVFAHENNDHNDQSLVSRSKVSPLTAMKNALAHSNEQIYALNRTLSQPDRKGMGTTLAGLYWPHSNDNRMIIAHVGDCRVYRLRDTVLHRLTHDHSAVQKWIDNGMSGTPPARNLLLRALGPTATIEADISTYVFLPYDVILLCSNGLTTMVSDYNIKKFLLQVAGGLHVEQGMLELINMAKANGGYDNITVAVCFFSNSHFGSVQLK